MNHIYILLTIALTVFGQLVIKWQVNKAGPLPINVTDKLVYLLSLLLNPWIICSLAAAFLAAMAWMAAMTHFPLSYAYPYVGLTFVLVLIGSGLFLGEPVSLLKISGTTLIVIGIAVASQG